MNTLIRKLASRKLWACIAGVTVGIATALGSDSSTIQTISGAVISAVSLVSYISSEAKVDAASVQGVNIEKLASFIKNTAEKSESTAKQASEAIREVTAYENK